MHVQGDLHFIHDLHFVILSENEVKLLCMISFFLQIVIVAYLFGIKGLIRIWTLIGKHACKHGHYSLNGP